MVAKKKLAWAELKVGMFVLIALALLIAFIFNATWGGKLFSLAPKQFYAETFLPTVERLKSGSPVWLSGLEVGHVTSVTFVPYSAYGKNAEILNEVQKLKEEIERLDQTQPPDYAKKKADLYEQVRSKKLALRTVKIVMKIDNQYRDYIRSDSEVSIGSSGLIGDSYIDISAGSFNEKPRQVFDPEIKREVLVIEGLRPAGIKEILTGANDVVANFAVLSEQVRKMASNIDVEKIGQTITQAGTNLDNTFKAAEVALNRANRLIVDVQEGKGTMGQFLVNSSVYDEFESTMENITDITDQVKSGKGTLGRALSDDSLYKDTDSILKRVDTIAERIEKGEGNIGLLSKDRALYDQANKTVEQINALTEQLNRGEGSLGKALKDDAMYNNVNQTLSEITKLIYDFRQNPKRFLTINFKIF